MAQTTPEHPLDDGEWIVWQEALLAWEGDQPNLLVQADIAFELGAQAIERKAEAAYEPLPPREGRLFYGFLGAPIYYSVQPEHPEAKEADRVLARSMKRIGAIVHMEDRRAKRTESPDRRLAWMIVQRTMHPRETD